MFLKNLTWEEQNRFIECTVEHELNKKYPVSPDYQRLFLKTVIKALENQNIEICDKIYENIPFNPSETTYKHYIHIDRAITLKESKSFVSEGTTGLCTWQASIALTNWFLQPNNRKIVDKKTILELGAGTGLCGLSLVKFCNPNKVILTDGSLPVVDNLKLNIGTNFENDDHIMEMLLPWENSQNIQLEAIDLIIAADVVYDKSVFEDLTSTILNVFNANENKCQLILASTIRNESTYSEFKEYLRRKGFAVKVCSIENHENFLFWNADTPIEILKVFMSD